MKLNFIKLLLTLLFISPAMYMVAQKAATGSKNPLPASFSISRADMNLILSKKPKEILKSHRNKYINKSTVLVSVINGDTKYVELKLNYFQNAVLSLQVNGNYSTQVFILSENKSFFYKGTEDKLGFVMNKSDEDEIVTE